MTESGLITLLFLALGLALQPWSILAAILLATTRGGTVKLVSFVAGWVLALTCVAVLTVVFYPDLAPTSGSSVAFSVIEIAAGVTAGIWLLYRWRHHRGAANAKQPGWMAKLDTMPPLLAFLLGGFLPNYVFVVAACSELLQLQLDTAELAISGLIFVVIASTGVAAPLAVRVFKGDHANAIYGTWRAWVLEHNRSVLFSVGAVLAVGLTVKGVIGLLG